MTSVVAAPEPKVVDITQRLVQCDVCMVVAKGFKRYTDCPRDIVVAACGVEGAALRRVWNEGHCSRRQIAERGVGCPSPTRGEGT